MMSLRVALMGALSILFVAGCGETGRDNPPDGRYRFLHAAPTLGSSAFLLEERQVASLTYTNGNASALLDSGPFDFHIETPSATSTNNERTASRAATIVAEALHTFVLYDDTGSPAIGEYSRPFADVTGSNAGLEVLHAFNGGPVMDVYVEIDGTDLAAAMPRGTLSFKQMLDPFTVPTGLYRLSATEPGNSANLLFQSNPVALSDGSRSLLGLFADAGLGTATIRGSIVDSDTGASVTLVDTLSLPELRTVHAATSAGALDVVADGNFSAPLQAGIAFGEISAYQTVPIADIALQVTPADDPGVLEIDDMLSAAAAQRLTQIINGSPGALTSTIIQDVNRGIAARAQFRIRHGGQLLPAVDIYFAPPGTGPDLTDLVPIVVGVTSGGSDFVSTALPGEIELLIVENDQDSTTSDTNIIAGPVPVAMADGRVYSIVMFDSATPGSLDVVVSDETAP